jgi:hypothetical protein
MNVIQDCMVFAAANTGAGKRFRFCSSLEMLFFYQDQRCLRAYHVF